MYIFHLPLLNPVIFVLSNKQKNVIFKINCVKRFEKFFRSKDSIFYKPKKHENVTFLLFGIEDKVDLRKNRKRCRQNKS